MSFGKLNTLVEIYEKINTKDSEGFKVSHENLITVVNAFMESKHGSRKWANLAAFTKADAIFQVRAYEELLIKPGYIIRCNMGDYQILSVENMGKLYLEILSQKIEGTKV